VNFADGFCWCGFAGRFRRFAVSPFRAISPLRHFAISPAGFADTDHLAGLRRLLG
jgi:hypothetical protein